MNKNLNIIKLYNNHTIIVWYVLYITVYDMYVIVLQYVMIIDANATLYDRWL